MRAFSSSVVAAAHHPKQDKKAQQQTHHVTKGDHPVWSASEAGRALRTRMVYAAFFSLL